MAPTLWLDVEDLFIYARGNPRPSGIQRVAFQMYRALQENHGESRRVRFVVHDPLRKTFRSVPWTQVAALFNGLTAQVHPSPARTAPGRPGPPSLPRVRRLVHRLPGSLRMPLMDAARAQASACRAWVELAAALAKAAPRMAKSAGWDRSVSGFSHREFAEQSKPGDVLLALGAPWSHRDYAGLVQAQRMRGLRFAVLVHDLIPVRHPEWCDRGLVWLFREWLNSLLPVCDTIFAVSRATATDVTAYAQDRGIALAPVLTLPIGLGFSGEPARHSERLPPPGSYVLFVSTIEARKNHALLFRIWQRLLQDLPEAQVPTLVFAGRVGWLVEDLLAQFANTDYLDGRLVFIESPTDSELAALYKGCLFTLFPSLYEGWGLPVTESLAFGKPCLAADRTALPEAGGHLARYFDPDNLHDAYAAIRSVIEDRPGLARWEARIRKEFRPVPWSATVDALMAGLANPAAGGRSAGATNLTAQPAS